MNDQKPRLFLASARILEFGQVRTRSVAERISDALGRYMQRSGLQLNANFPADIQALVDAPGSGQPLTTRMKANRLQGRVRVFESIFRAPASGTAPAIADKIIWGKLPVRVRPMGYLGRLDCNTGTASSTINLGDQFVAARYLAASSVASTANFTPSVASLVTSAVADTTLGLAVLSNVKSIGAFTVGTVIAGTGVPTGTYVTGVDVAGKNVFVSAVATATGTSIAITTNGGYETSDDSSNIGNGYASTTDDCTLISVVAGAQIANNQIIKLVMPFVQD